MKKHSVIVLILAAVVASTAMGVELKELAVNQPVEGKNAAGANQMTVIDEDGNLKVVEGPNKQQAAPPQYATPPTPNPTTQPPSTTTPPVITGKPITQTPPHMTVPLEPGPVITPNASPQPAQQNPNPKNGPVPLQPNTAGKVFNPPTNPPTSSPTNANTNTKE